MHKLQFQPFQDYITKNSIARTRERYNDSILGEGSFENNIIRTKVTGTRLYDVEIVLDGLAVKSTKCSCPYDDKGICKHVINVMVNYDTIVKNKRLFSATSEIQNIKTDVQRIGEKYIIENKKVLEIDHPFLTKNTKLKVWQDEYLQFSSGQLDKNSLHCEISSYSSSRSTCTIEQLEKHTVATCSCIHKANTLCAHLHFVFKQIIDNNLKICFDEKLRLSLLEKAAKQYGIQETENLETTFSIHLEFNTIRAKPRFNFINFNHPTLKNLKEQITSGNSLPKNTPTKEKVQFILIKGYSYRNELEIEFVDAPLTKQGQIKNPVALVPSSHIIKGLSDPKLFSFYASFKTYDECIIGQASAADLIPVVKEIVKNPLQLPVYYFDESKSNTGKANSKNIREIKIQQAKTAATIFVKHDKENYQVTCKFLLDNREYNTRSLKIAGKIFVWTDKETLCMIDNTKLISVLQFFEDNRHTVVVHKSQFSYFQEEFLNKMENSMKVEYAFVKSAPAKVIKELKLDAIEECKIYLSESDDFILISPVVKYGETEVGALSKRTIYANNPEGGLYSIARKEEEEASFVRSIQAQHPHFAEQSGNEFFYLEKSQFMDEGWFLDAFEFWREQNYAILGFNQIKSNRLNTNKINIQTRVKTGIDWFEVDSEVAFGDQTVSLKQIQKSIVNKSRYVELGDGTLGLLPDAWIKKFGNYFRSGELIDGKIHLHKTNFSLIDELFEDEVLSTEALEEVNSYKQKLANFHSISSVQVPKKLKATLRDYQKEGLNWLNFLDEFGFGGCLADDMGLGKTIQIIAYFLVQIEKGNKQPNLVVIPTSLLFNWQEELKKFAPHLKVKVVYGLNRDLENGKFDKYNLVLTTYGTLLSDIELLKKVTFNCVVLDESQAIKNPSSKRYKAVRLLQARQRIVMTGTPVENNTFDLYAQLSFALPGLLGNAKKFADSYSTPIDKYQDVAMAKELQAKIHPFVLRRTKSQVAKELPEKTEMVIHCEMGQEQQRVYDLYKKEFQDMLNGTESTDGSSALHILQGLTKLRQICNSPALLSDEAYYGAESAKLTELMEQIEGKKDDHKVLVFSQFVTMLDLVKEKLAEANIGYAYLTGKTKDRQKQVELFQNDETIRVFLISLKAGGTGLNLTKAEYVFLIDPWWNPAVENQAIDRAYRIGQENKVIAIRLITPNTIEEKIIELQQRKKQLASDLVHTDANVLKQLSKADLMKMV